MTEMNPPATELETISNWFDEFHNFMEVLMGGSKLPPNEREVMKQLIHTCLDIAETVVSDLNRAATAQERAAAAQEKVAALLAKAGGEC